ncbi:MAG TPA: succinate dehydrogenase/fumarate reductase iron-sulfur subunit [Candidatus Hydrogenedentes bacterium]|mgnify:FL=1|nr:succinate dehydrogenase/fumarate reductase iron-sulfur subunit [Candidatus Hydrogenedentota bacterium]
MDGKTISLTLKVWRQPSADAPGKFQTIPAKDVSTDISFLEMLDIVNAGLEARGEEPVAFDHDCREGICGSCGAVVNGQAHGPQAATTLCQLHMRKFKDGDTIIIEPFRARAFPVIKDLVVDRGALDRIIQAGGYISVRTGAAPDAHAVPVKKDDAERAMDAAACIGCGACVAACPNASAMLFTSAKITQLCKLPQGHPERNRRVVAMVRQMDAEGFGSCSKHYECQAACPKEVKVENITLMNREYLRALAGLD